MHEHGKSPSIYTIKREGALKNLLMQDCWTYLLVNYFLVLSNISLTI